MRNRRELGSRGAVLWGAGLAALGLLSLGGCVHHVHVAGEPSVHARGHGPPPHAPAHGYRHKHGRDGVELAFDADLDVWVVVSRPGIYWYGERYLRWYDGRWIASPRLDGHWVVVARGAVPVGLVRMHTAHRKKHKGHRKSWPARHAD